MPSSALQTRPADVRPPCSPPPLRCMLVPRSCSTFRGRARSSASTALISFSGSHEVERARSSIACYTPGNELRACLAKHDANT
eukprot:1923501-Pleurochrysis_carterae.AAC.1